jgi:hypothetical protein
MYVPGYTADASLYRSARMYRPFNSVKLTQATAAAPRLTLAQVSGTDCIALCQAVEASCAVACLWAGPGLPACEVACAVADTACVLLCPPGPADGGGGFGGGPRRCCPPGTRCCGACVPLPSKGFQCDDVCVGPHESCP